MVHTHTYIHLHTHAHHFLKTIFQYQNRLDKLCIIYIKCTIKECIRRDPKGLYRKAINGEINTLIGYNTPYNKPSIYHFEIDTNSLSAVESVNKILSFCMEKKLLKKLFYK